MAETVMMKLGSFKFSIYTAAYQQLTRTYGWVWGSTNRFGNTSILQYTGKDNPTINLPGVIYPEFENVGTEQIKELVALGDAAKPHLMTSGLGDVMGYWVVTGLRETEDKHIAAGIPIKQTFSLDLKFYGQTLSNP